MNLKWLLKLPLIFSEHFSKEYSGNFFGFSEVSATVFSYISSKLDLMQT